MSKVSLSGRQKPRFGDVLAKWRLVTRLLGLGQRFVEMMGKAKVA